MGLSEFPRMIEGADEVAREEGGTLLRFMSDLKSSVSDIREGGAILSSNYIRNTILRYVKSCEIRTVKMMRQYSLTSLRKGVMPRWWRAGTIKTKLRMPQDVSTGEYFPE